MPASPVSSASLTAPISLHKNQRIIFLDGLRGIALLGILTINIMAQGQSHVFYGNMDLNQPLTGPNFWVWATTMGFFEGTMRGLFSILFGAGTILLLSRIEKARGHIDAADIYYRRMLWLLVFGLINAYIFLWSGDILYAYALCGLVLFPFRKLSPKILLLLAAVLLAFGSYRDTKPILYKKALINNGKQAERIKNQHHNLNEKQAQDLKAWKEYREKNNSEGTMRQAMDETAKVQSSGYRQLFAYYREISINNQSVEFYNTWWDVMVFFFLGMALYKSGFIAGNKPVWLYAFIGVTGTVFGVAISYWLWKPVYVSRFDMTVYAERLPFGIYQLRRVLQTLGYLSLFILINKVVYFKGIFRFFAPVGQMAFTNYLSQSVITAVIFYGFGLYGRLQRYELCEVMVAIWVFQIIFSTVWLRYFWFGPFEWVWRSLTYVKRQPFLRIKATTDKTVSLTAAAV